MSILKATYHSQKMPIEGIRRLILGKAIPAALEKYQPQIVSGGLTIEDVEANIDFIAKDLAMRGFAALRGRDDKGQTDYELFHACVLAAILNIINPKLRHSVYYLTGVRFFMSSYIAHQPIYSDLLAQGAA